MNKKGFTLIELVAVIAIIAVISTIGMISYNSLISTSADKVFNEYQDTMYVAASNYMTKNYTKLKPMTSGEHKGHIYVKLMIDDLKIETIRNPKNSSVDCKANSYVEIIDDKNCAVKSFKYTVCLKCADNFDNCRSYFSGDCTD